MNSIFAGIHYFLIISSSPVPSSPVGHYRASCSYCLTMEGTGISNNDSLVNEEFAKLSMTAGGCCM